MSSASSLPCTILTSYSRAVPSLQLTWGHCVQFKSRKGKDLRISYPCVVLNVMVAKHNTNDQYQTLVDARAKRYETSSRMSIEFEVDGPYKASPLT